MAAHGLYERGKREKSDKCGSGLFDKKEGAGKAYPPQDFNVIET